MAYSPGAVHGRNGSSAGYRQRLLPLLAILFMGQTTIPEKKGEMIRYKEISFGAMYNTLTLFPEYAYDMGCSGPLMRPAEPRRENLYTIGMGYSINNIYAKYSKGSFGINGFLGLKEETNTNNYEGRSGSGSEINIGVCGSYSHDWRWFGFKGGILLGYFHIDGAYTKAKSVGEYSGLLKPLYVMPEISLCVGPMEYLFLDLRITDHPAGRAPHTFANLGMGTRLGKFNGTLVRAGLTSNFRESFSGDVPLSGYYAQVVYPIKEKFVVDVYASSNFASGNSAKTCISIGFHYRLGYETIQKKTKTLRIKTVE